MDALSRRALVTSAAALGLSLYGRDASAQIAPTPSCDDGDAPTASQTEGPFFRRMSPRRDDLREANARSRPALLQGTVLTRGCRPLAGAVVDVWHADEAGAYDNAGFRYRGHVLTDASGRFRMRSIVPGVYPGRTRHFHVKVQAPRARLLTTQLYFPDEPRNADDSLFDPALLLRVASDGEALAARFDFVLDLA